MRHKALTLTIFAMLLSGNASARETVSKTLSYGGTLNLGLAQNYLIAGDPGTALDKANLALRSDPDSAEVHVTLGMIYNKVRDEKHAGEQFARAVQLAPTQGPILNAYAVWQCEQGLFAQADGNFQQAAQDPFYKTPAEAWFNAGKCAYGSGDAVKADGYLRKSLEKWPDDPAGLQLMAQVQFAQGHFMDARAFLQRREALGSPRPELYVLGSKIEEGAGDAKAAERYRQRLREEFPEYTPPAGEGSRSP